MNQFISLIIFLYSVSCMANGNSLESARKAKFITINAGSFSMGSPLSELGRNDDENIHHVTMSRDFEMQDTVVTQAQYYAVMKNNPSTFHERFLCPKEFIQVDNVSLCPNHPVEEVSWENVQSFLAALNAADSDFNYRLPTEAEWEYAARANSKTAYWHGNTPQKLKKNSCEYAILSGNLGYMTRSVGQGTPNSWGLYDMHGNVWQWTSDWYDKNYSQQELDPLGPTDGKLRVIRGGGYREYVQCKGESSDRTKDKLAKLRSAYRSNYTPVGNPNHFPNDISQNDIGFRLVRTRK